MKSYHLAALALVGWYLMMPPVKNGKVMEAPLTIWAHLDSFDSASECRKAGYDLMERAQTKDDANAANRLISASNFECIETDDPRLKSN